MKLHLSGFGLAGFVAAALSVSGSTQSGPAAPTEAMTVTGCLRENPMRAGAYLLDALEGGSGEKGYRLIGSGSADLKPHIGHKVKVTGTVAKSAASSAAPAPGAATSRGAEDGPAMNVTVVAHVADTCAAPFK